MPAQKKYPDELRQRAVRLVLDAQSDRSTATGAIGRVAEQLGINKETLRGWVNQAKVDAGDKPGTTTSDAERLAHLEK